MMIARPRRETLGPALGFPSMTRWLSPWMGRMNKYNRPLRLTVFLGLGCYCTIAAAQKPPMASVHGAPSVGAECASCMEDLSDENYAEYQATEGGPWLPSVYCSECLNILLSRKWEDWKNAVINTKCEAEWRRLMKVGPPVNLRDPKALPCPDDGEIVALWFMSDGHIHSAKLQGSLEGEERLTYWNELLQFKPSPKHGEVDPDDEAEEQEQGRRIDDAG